MEKETDLSPEKSCAPPHTLDSLKTLDGGVEEQETGSPSFNMLSPLSDESCADSEELFHSFDDEPEGKEPKAEEDDFLRNDFGASSDSHWALPWPRSTVFNRNPLRSCRPSEWFAEKPVEVEASQNDSTWLPQNLTTARTGAGLENLGNTCFLNAVLQCFIHTVPLLDCILSDSHAVRCSGYEEWFCILCTLYELVKISLTSTNRVISPWKLVDNLSYFSSGFHRYQQEDAHEFLQCFLDKLESCIYSERKDSDPLHDENFVKRVFGGRLVSKLKCCNCGHCSDTYEPFIDLSLEIEDADNLLIALESFTKVERIEDPEMTFTCEECKEKVSIEKQLTFDKVPSVAAFHLKRFKNDGGFVQKIDKQVKFPKELDLLPFTCRDKTNDGELKYVLYAIVVHAGFTSTSGHYYCFIRLSPDMWYKFDDTTVVRVHEEYVLSQEAYILLYAKEGTPWFSSFIETQKLCVEPSILNTSPKSVLDHVGISSPSTGQNKFNSGSDDVNNASGSEAVCTCSNDINTGGPQINKLVSNGFEDNLLNMSVPVAQLAGNCLDVPTQEAQKENSPTLPGKVNISVGVGSVGNGLNITLSPPRSPSPEIYREDPPGFCIPRSDLRSVERISCKRRLVKDDDMERKQAFSLAKSMPGSRGQQILAALKGSKSVDSGTKKTKRFEASLSRDDSNTATHRSSIRTSLRPLVAGTSR